MKLILTEKPSVAKDIAKAINASESGPGFIRNSEYLITWAFGHLLQIDDKMLPEGRWSFDNLPLFPEHFNYTTTAETGKQFRIIKDLLNQANDVIIATDAGREGELIARLILNKAGWTTWEKTYRLWSSEALTPAVVNKCLSNLAPARKYDSLYYAALTRQHGDWITGINLTQAVTIQTGGAGLWSVGRVQTPTLRIIVDRDLARRNFKPEKYYVIKALFSAAGTTYEGYYFKDSNDNQVTGEEDLLEPEPGGRLNKSLADSVVSFLNNITSGSVASVKKEKKAELPPLLHSLTSLQREANTAFGLSAQKTLDIAQELYEKHKVLSYPRTDSQHMAESSKELVADALQLVGQADLLPALDTVGKRVFNDAKLTDHHAIIPLKPAPSDLTKDERSVYNLVFRKFIGAFMPAFEYEAAELITSLKNCYFKSNGRVVLVQGWKDLYPKEEKEALPDLAEGQEVKKERVDLLEKLTKPDPAYTEASLLAKMEKFNLGTPATRASIIETLIHRLYIGRDKKNLFASSKGHELIEKLSGRKFIDPELTSSWEIQLEDLWKENKGQAGYHEFINNLKVFVREEIELVKTLNIRGISYATAKMFNFAKELATKHKVKLESQEFEYIKDFIDKYSKETPDLGRCGCGKEISESLKAYNCECGKLVWKEQFKKKISLKNAQDLMNGKSVVLKGCTGKTGKFDATVKLGAGNKLEFVK